MLRVSPAWLGFQGAAVAVAPRGTVWLCRPKKASGLQSDLDQPTARRYGMDRGLVDFKVAAIDATWSGLRFARNVIATIVPMADAALDERLEQIGAQLDWVRDYL